MHHAEQYLVKATVTLGEQVVATALAADQNLTVADDQAKARVLAMLGFEAAASVQPSTLQPPQQVPVTNTNGSASDTNISASDDVTSVTSAKLPQTTDNEDIGRPIDSFTPDEAPAPSQVPASSLAAPTLESFDDSHPVDLSDIIAQTDVEMARLGWSNVQGRTYLEKTFNKRSRQQLTDEELLTFLLYLESQTTPTMD